MGWIGEHSFTVAEPDDLGDPRFVKSEENAPEIERSKRGATSIVSQTGEKEEMCEVEPVCNQKRPWIVQARSRARAGKYLGAGEGDEADEETAPK